MVDAFSLGCAIGNGWCFISWNSKGVTNKMPQSWSPSAGKLEKRLYFPPHYGDETTTSYKRAFGKGGVRFPFWERFCYGMWLFLGSEYVVVSSLQCSEYIAFFPFSHWRNLWLRHLAGYSFKTLRKKSINHFLGDNLPTKNDQLPMVIS